jgi:putative acetyltransferase
MNIREYNNKDKDRILEIWYKASKQAHYFLSENLLQFQKKEIEYKYLAIATTWVAEESGIICGFISLLDNYIGGLFIDTQYQGRGIGKSLIDKAIDEKDFLTVGVYAKNKNARKFYQKTGFSFVGEELQKDTGEVVINMILNR